MNLIGVNIPIKIIIKKIIKLGFSFPVFIELTFFILNNIHLCNTLLFLFLFFKNNFCPITPAMIGQKVLFTYLFVLPFTISACMCLAADKTGFDSCNSTENYCDVTLNLLVVI